MAQTPPIVDRGPVDRLMQRAIAGLQEFLGLEAAGGLLLIAASAIALVIANSPWAHHAEEFLELPVAVTVGAYSLDKPLTHWINDGLMAVFFFLVGLELKREVLEGHLSSLRRAALPAFAALGGMLVPAAIYAALNARDPAALRGWAIPSATDIAFALGVLSLLGDRVPTALKAFLLSIAIFDDVGAIIVIAIYYTDGLSLPALALSGVVIAALAVVNRAGVTRPAAYLVLGALLWAAVLESGVHATLAGLVVAFAIPLRGRSSGGAEDSPLLRLEHALHPWVAFGVLPLFGFANAGVPLSGITGGDLVHPVPVGIVLGLLVGKPLGIVAFSWAAVSLRLATLPEGLRWPLVHGAGVLCGTGFTMSLFIASLAFEHGGGAISGLERLGILAGSALSAAAGYLVLRRALAGAPGDA